MYHCLVDLTQLVREMALEDIKTENLDEMVQMLEQNLSNALNKQAPEVTKVITERKIKPWFGDDLKQQKRIVRRREKVFRKYRSQSCWTALVRLMTHTARICSIFDVANSQRYRAGFAPMLFQWCHAHIARFSL